MRRAMLITCALAMSAHAGCTDASLYGKGYAPNYANRISFTGELCTDDPSAIDFPQKTLVVMDATGDMTGADPGGRRATALQRLLDRRRGAGHPVSIILMGAQARSLIPGFSSDSVALGAAAEAAAAAAGEAQRSYLDALRMASTVVEDDLLGSDPGTRSRTRYQVLFVAAGPPSPPTRDLWCVANGMTTDSGDCASNFGDTFCGDVEPAPTDCERYLFGSLVSNLRSFVRSNGAQDLTFHSFALTTDSRAAALLGDMARSGLGQLVQQTPATLDFLAVETAASQTRLLLRELTVFNPNALLRGKAPVPDSDADGLSDAEEVKLGTNPLLADTDGDGVGDGIEVLLAAAGTEFNPLVPAAFSQCVNLVDPTADRDLDGLNDCEEAVLRTEPTLADTDRDGIPDLVEVRLGGNPLVDDRLTDSDLDGIQNGEEVREGLDPWTNDSARDLDYGYQYRTVDEGPTRRIEATPKEPFAGVRINAAKQGAYSVWTLRLAFTNPPRLAWADEPTLAAGAEDTPGSYVEITQRGDLTLAGATGGSLTITVDPSVFPAPGSPSQDAPVTLRETLRTCFQMDVRNISLVETAETSSGRAGRGWNMLHMYLGEVPEDSPDGHTIFQAATIPVRFLAPDTKVPDVPFIHIAQDDLILLAPE